MASVPLRGGGDAGLGADASGALPAGALVAGLFNTAAVLVSAALIAGLVVWGYRLAVRDVVGVPVLRALDGPARVAPADPGGELARHIGLSVTAVAAAGTAPALPEQVVLAPRPLDLDATDAPMAALAPLPAALAPPAATVLPLAPAFAAALPLPDLASGADGSGAATPVVAATEQDALILALAEAMAYDAALTPVARAEPLPSQTGIAATARADLVPASVPGVVRSPRPALRPLRVLAAAPALDLAPEALVAGMRLVQLGAFPTREAAEAEWNLVAARFEAMMAGKQRVIQEAASGGRVFYRLRVAGFADADESRQFCAALTAEQANCVPAQVF